MALVGYARVSSVGQSLEVQLEKLKSCDKLYQESTKKSGGQAINDGAALAGCIGRKFGYQ
jgi:DNA invertase Pin-like site-specific DNA recombinase